MNNFEERVTDYLKLEITQDAIDPSVVGGLAAAKDGALVSFLGVVRDHSEGKSVVGLDYEAYEEMAVKEMKRIAEQAKEKWPVTNIAMIHRTGSLKVGEISVAIAVTAPHRAEAFDACEFLIDTLKQTVPIWKKELFGDGSSSWVEHA